LNPRTFDRSLGIFAPAATAAKHSTQTAMRVIFHSLLSSLVEDSCPNILTASPPCYTSIRANRRSREWFRFWRKLPGSSGGDGELDGSSPAFMPWIWKVAHFVVRQGAHRSRCRASGLAAPATWPCPHRTAVPVFRSGQVPNDARKHLMALVPYFFSSFTSTTSLARILTVARATPSLPTSIVRSTSSASEVSLCIAAICAAVRSLGMPRSM